MRLNVFIDMAKEAGFVVEDFGTHIEIHHNELNQNLAVELDRFASLVAEHISTHFDKDVKRLDWLSNHAKEVLLDERRAASEICPDFRTKWELPTIMCSGPVGGYSSFRDGIDVLMEAEQHG